MRTAVLLAGLSAAFFAAFVAQRSCSTFLAVEACADRARAVAERAGLDLTEVMALHEIAGGDLSEAELARLAADFVRWRERLGHGSLAAVALFADAEVARALWREAEGDGARARRRLRGRRGDLVAVRFEKMVERFASRQAAR